jgi:hypothetical protein
LARQQPEKEITMPGDVVSWRDYQGLGSMSGLHMDENAFAGGLASGQDVDALNKALSAGSAINNPGSAPGEGFPLRVESLDQTLFNVTYSAKDIKFWKSLTKDAAYNTVEEFNRLESYGSGDSIWIGEGDLPSEDDSTYSRQYTRIKFMGTVRRVTHVLSVMRAAHGDAVARETVNGTLFLLRQLERSLFVGDERMIPIQIDGIEKLLVEAFNSTEAEDGQYLGYEDFNVIDLRGEALTEDHVTDLAERLTAEPNYGAPSDLWLPTGPMKDLSKILYPKERYDLPAPNGGKAGIAINTIVTPFGDISLNPDIFIPDSVRPNASGVGKAASRPGAPTVAAPTSPVYAGSNTTFWASTDAGTYFYKVVAGSRYGQSAPATSAAIAVSAGDQVSIGLTDNGPDTTYYTIYRSDKDGTAATCRTIMRVARTGPTQTVVDLNRFMPNTSKGYMLSQQRDVLKWRQLAPFTKIPLATIDTSIRWQMIMYGALQLMKPRYNGMFINIGKLETGANA